MIYDALEVARYIIYHEDQEERPVSNLRLQKLLYFVQAKFLVEKGEPCFKQRMEAWNFGPVVPKVYKVYRYYGSTPIPCKDESSDFSIQSSDRKRINSMLDSCSRYATSTLVDITHEQEPWIQAHQTEERVITPVSIYDYFTRRS